MLNKSISKYKNLLHALIAIAFIGLIITFISSVLMPLLIALLITYIINPIVEKLQSKFKLKRTTVSLICAISILIIFASIPLFIIPSILIQLKNIVAKIPALINLFNKDVLGVINSKYGLSLSLDIDVIKNFAVHNITSVYNRVDFFSPLARNGLNLIKIIGYIVLIPFISFYTIRNWHYLLSYCYNLIPYRYRKSSFAIIKDMDNMLSAYLRGQITVMLIMASYYGILLSFTHLSSGFVIGFITGFLVFIPYLGIIFGLFLALLISFADFYSLNSILIILAIFIGGHILEGGLVTPVLVGGKLGLNPIMIILALIAFGKVFGLVGVLLSLPLSAITVVLFRHIKSYYLKSDFYNN